MPRSFFASGSTLVPAYRVTPSPTEGLFATTFVSGRTVTVTGPSAPLRAPTPTDPGPIASSGITSTESPEPRFRALLTVNDASVIFDSLGKASAWEPCSRFCTGVFKR